MAQTLSDLEWRISDALVPYDEAVTQMEARVAAIRAGTVPEQVWLLEHPPLYSAGTSARPDDLVAPNLLPVFRTGRGGQYTYHGPGQRVGYVMLDLQKRGGDLRAYVRDLEEWLIRTLQHFNIKGERREGRVGIWIAESGGKESKIAAIGVRVRHWVSFHGVSLNVDPDLSHYRGIVPCGISEHGVTSLAALGITATMPEVDTALKAAFAEVFATDAAAATAGRAGAAPTA
ncbi:MAG TPA: lipoyl(octanoyl) transferase LipB [Stellaceae bacterium]|jgi:lipoyl(octanoyl) transferase|nr:lipoyl(octanoyl) transferase LipB [Stellaceae bacterium]